MNCGGAYHALKYFNDDVFSDSNASVGADVDTGVVATVAEFISDVGSISDVDGISGVTAN